jgi:hypothetical protein
MLGIGSRRRAAVEAADGSVAFAETSRRRCHAIRARSTRRWAPRWLATFKGFVERPVTMLV